MANKIKEIKNFFAGLMSSFSSSDIKDESASFSLNVDSGDKDGILRGTKKEIDLISGLEIDTNMSKVIESEPGIFDLVYTDVESGDVNTIFDLYGAKSIKTPINASGAGGKAESMEVKNDKVYVGHGKELRPKILYKTKHTPFQKESEIISDWIYEDSSLYDKRLLNSSFSVDRFINLPGSSDQAYSSAVGIRYDHKDLYFINYEGRWDDTKDLYDLNAANAKIHLGASDVGKNALSGAACDICQADVKFFANSVQEVSGQLLTIDCSIWVLAVAHSQSEAVDAVPSLRKIKISEVPGRTRDEAAGQAAKGNFDSSLTYYFEFEEGDAPPNGAVPGSVLETEHYVWVSYWKPTGDNFARDENFLYCASLEDVPAAGGVITFKNKSLNYDKITKKRATINFGNKNFTETHKETYFYNSDQSWETLKSGNWIRGSQDWDDRSSDRGNHKYSGIHAVEGDPGFKIVRHGLIQSPMTDKENPAFPDYNEGSGEDWVGILATCEEQMINIYSAWSYRVAGGWNWHSYHRLRAADDDGDGSWKETGIWGGILEIILGLYNILDFLFNFVFGGAVATFMDKFGIWPGAGAEFYTRLLYGAEDLNWYYNGKCFETGLMRTPLINISSEHKPEGRFNSEDGARVHIKELYGFDSTLEIICVRHYNDRLMISAHDPSQTDKFLNTLFLMWNTSDNSPSETSKVGVMVLDPSDENLDADWREHASVPEEYLAVGSSKDTGNEKPNQILQMYIPLTDLATHDYSSYPELFADVDDQLQTIYPHLNSYFFFVTEEVAKDTSHLWNKGLTGDIYFTEDATFDIYRTNLNRFDGRTTIFNTDETSNGIGYSGQVLDAVDTWRTEGDHISFMSTSGPFNISKFNFKLVGNSTIESNQLNMPESPGEIFPADDISIIGLNQNPNSSDDENIKQYSLDSKSISFNVKAHAFSGSNLAPFYYNDVDGKELYRYKINLVYDGYQDSPLCNHYTEVNITDTHVKADDTGRASALAVTINLHKPEIISRRVTDIRLWRSRNSLNEGTVAGDDVYTIEQDYSLVTTIPLGVNWLVGNEASTLYNSPSTDTTLGNVASFTYVDNGVEDASFEAYTSMPEDIKIYQPNYTISTQLHAYLFVGDCKHPSFEDATNIIFRSRPDKFNTFDWTRDFVSIPSTPKAMTSFNGRIIVWDFNNMYVINAGGLYIEDTYEGTGCLNSSSFERTEFGICFADEHNIYLYDGSKVTNIGVPVITSHKQGLKISWRDRDREYPTHINFESEKRCFCIFFRISGAEPFNWLLRAIKAAYYEAYSDLDPAPQKWFEIPGADTNFLYGEQQYKYVWHLGMWTQYFQNNGSEGHPDNLTQEEIFEFYQDYTFNPEYKNIVLPYGTGYNVETGKYIVDLQAFCSGIHINGILKDWEKEVVLENNLFVLQKGDFPNYLNIITNGKLDFNARPSYYFFTYNIDKSRWDLQETSKYKGVFAGAKGELYSSMVTRDDYALDIEATANVQTFYTKGTTPLGGSEGIIDALDLQFGQLTTETGLVNISYSDWGQDKNEQIGGMSFHNANAAHETPKYRILSAEKTHYILESDGLLSVPCLILNLEVPHTVPYEHFYDGTGTGFPNSDWTTNGDFVTCSVYDSSGTNTEWGVYWPYPSSQWYPTEYQEDGNEETPRIMLYFETSHWNASSNTQRINDLVDTLADGNGYFTFDNVPLLEEEEEDNDDIWSGYSDGANGRYVEVTTIEPHGRQRGDNIYLEVSDNYAGQDYNRDYYFVKAFEKPLKRTISYVSGPNKFRFEVFDNEPHFSQSPWQNSSYLAEYHEWYYYRWHSNWPQYDPEAEQPDGLYYDINWTSQYQFESLWIGDLNRDGGVNIQDVAVILNDYTYIALKGWEFLEKAWTVDGFPYFPDILLIDETTPNNYHRLVVDYAYQVGLFGDGSEESKLTYILVKKQTYPFETDYGWNYSSDYTASNHFPEDSKIILNTDTIILPGESGLKELFASDNSNQFTFISKNFSFENQTVNKLLSKIKIVFHNTRPVFEYMVNNNNEWIAPKVSEIIWDETCLTYNLPPEHKKAKSIKIKIMSGLNESNAQHFDTEVDSFSIIYRERGNA